MPNELAVPCLYLVLIELPMDLAVLSASQASKAPARCRGLNQDAPATARGHSAPRLVPVVTDTLIEVTRVTPATLWQQRVDGQIVDLAIQMVVEKLINLPRKKEASGAWELRLQ